jgi:hypothetical protein
VSEPQAKDGEVLVQIVAAGVNFVDILYVSFASTLCQLSSLPSDVILSNLFSSSLLQCAGSWYNQKVALIVPALMGHLYCF